MSDFGPEVDVAAAAYIDPDVRIHGRVTVGEGSSLWPNTVIRAESFEVRIGRYTNLQDFVMVHIGYDTPTMVGDYCSITHHVTLHGCTVGNNCLIGINATLMDGVVVGDNCIVAGHTFLKEGTVIPDNSIVMGTPGSVVRTRNSFVPNRVNAMLYYHNALAYAQGRHRVWSEDDFAEVLARDTAGIEAEFARLYGEGGG